MDTSLLTIVDFPVNGTMFKLCEMPFGLAREHVKSGRALMDKGEAATAEEWYDRTLSTVFESLQRAGDTEWTVEKMQLKLGKNTLDAMFTRVLEISGLRIPETPGEAKAA